MRTIGPLRTSTYQLTKSSAATGFQRESSTAFVSTLLEQKVTGTKSREVAQCFEK